MHEHAQPGERRGLTRRRFLDRSATLAAGLAAPSVLSGCFGGDEPAETTQGSPASGTPKSGGTLKVAFIGGGTKESLDPGLGISEHDDARVTNIFDTLTVLNDDSTVDNYLAESFEPNADATRWQIKLRSGVTFHNGKPLTADDVLYTFRRILDPKEGQGGATILEPLDLKRSKKVDKLTIELALKRPIAELPFLFQRDDIAIVQDGATDFSKPVGTGPFELVSFTPGEGSTFRKNKNYWVDDKPYVDELQTIAIPDNSARLNALLEGRVDAIEKIEFPQARANANNDAVKIIRSDSTWAVPITMSLASEPFSDPRVLEAFKLSMDRPETVARAFLGFGSIGNDLFGKGTQYYNDELPQRKYDPEKARSLLRQAGREDVQVTLYSSTLAPGMLESATIFAEQAKESGIRIKVEKLDNDTYYGSRYLKEPMYQSQWVGGFFEVIAAQCCISDAPYNETAWKKPEWDREFRIAQGTLNDDQRKSRYFDLQEVFWREGGYLVWGYYDLIDAVAPNVMGVTPRRTYSLGAFDFKSYWLT
jgi:peptide/nickel transport system substrate-binding protein